uniref:Uncharacterized protein n=1 Tax=Oryza meridionalis TaxID=40149 RepID=A0A0E0DTT7_9ORYZ
MEYLRKSLDRQFSADEVLQLLDRFFNLEMLKPEDDEKDNFTQGEEFSLPESFDAALQSCLSITPSAITMAVLLLVMTDEMRVRHGTQFCRKKGQTHWNPRLGQPPIKSTGGRPVDKPRAETQGGPHPSTTETEPR